MLGKRATPLDWLQTWHDRMELRNWGRPPWTVVALAQLDIWTHEGKEVVVVVVLAG